MMMGLIKSHLAVYACLVASCSAFGFSPLSLTHTRTQMSTTPVSRFLRGGRSGVQMSAKPKLTYFDARGVAETARLMYKAAKVDFEDERLAVSGTPPKSPMFEEMKAAGKLAKNMNRAPLLKDGDLEIGQSHTINRYIAAKHGFMGENPADAAIIDSIYESVRDIRDQFSRVRFWSTGTPEEKAAATDKFLKEAMPEWCAKLDQQLAAFTPKEGGFAYGNKLSLADFAIYVWIESLDLSPTLKEYKSHNQVLPWAGSSRITRSIEAVKHHPEVVKWLQSRPNTVM